MKIITVAGTRPNFIKISPLCRTLEKYRENVKYILVHTGQHQSEAMSEAFFNDLEIPQPHISFATEQNSTVRRLASIMCDFESVCQKHRPDWVVVVGDVDSTLACALAAVKTGIRVAHVEAGLRSFDWSMPEEVNRVVTDSLSARLFAPTDDAVENLLKEGMAREKILNVGNIMIDTLAANLEKALERKTPECFGLAPKNYVYATLHRPHNVDEKYVLAAVLQAMERLSKTIPIVFPVHPRTRRRMEEFGLERFLTPKPGNSLFCIPPARYHDSVCLAAQARLVITDSGGVQEEAAYLGTPCLTLRPNTERVATIIMGANSLTSPDFLENDVEKAICAPAFRLPPPRLWDGQSSQRIVESLLADN